MAINAAKPYRRTSDEEVAFLNLGTLGNGIRHGLLRIMPKAAPRRCLTGMFSIFLNL
jgi:hypothetical protein